MKVLHLPAPLSISLKVGFTYPMQTSIPFEYETLRPRTTLRHNSDVDYSINVWRREAYSIHLVSILSERHHRVHFHFISSFLPRVTLYTILHLSTETKVVNVQWNSIGLQPSHHVKGFISGSCFISVLETGTCFVDLRTLLRRPRVAHDKIRRERPRSARRNPGNCGWVSFEPGFWEYHFPSSTACNAVTLIRVCGTTNDTILILSANIVDKLLILRWMNARKPCADQPDQEAVMLQHYFAHAGPSTSQFAPKHVTPLKLSSSEAISISSLVLQEAREKEPVLRSDVRKFHIEFSVRHQIE
jgi:hypothetical protein